jgi:hypothetical protein
MKKVCSLTFEDTTIANFLCVSSHVMLLNAALANGHAMSSKLRQDITLNSLSLSMKVRQIDERLTAAMHGQLGVDVLSARHSLLRSFGILGFLGGHACNRGI